MNEVICPVDGRPCDPECPDRFMDLPEGGCVLTLEMDLGALSVGRVYDYGMALLP